MNSPPQRHALRVFCRTSKTSLANRPRGNSLQSAVQRSVAVGRRIDRILGKVRSTGTPRPASLGSVFLVSFDRLVLGARARLDAVDVAARETPIPPRSGSGESSVFLCYLRNPVHTHSPHASRSSPPIVQTACESLLRCWTIQTLAHRHSADLGRRGDNGLIERIRLVREDRRHADRVSRCGSNFNRRVELRLPQPQRSTFVCGSGILTYEHPSELEHRDRVSKTRGSRVYDPVIDSPLEVGGPFASRVKPPVAADPIRTQPAGPPTPAHRDVGPDADAGSPISVMQAPQPSRHATNVGCGPASNRRVMASSHLSVLFVLFSV